MTLEELRKLVEEMEKGLIEDNRFTIVDEDEHQLLGRINLLIGKIKDLIALIDATQDASNEAVKQAKEALEKCEQALEYARGAYDASKSAEDKAQEAIDKTIPLDTLIPELQQALATIDAVNARMDKVEENTQNALEQAGSAHDTAGEALETASDAFKKSQDNETKNTEQDGAISKAQTTADGAVEMNNTQNGRLTEIETKNTTQDGRLTALETTDTAHEEKMATLEKAINDEATTRAANDKSIRDEINRLVSSETDLNEEILGRLDELETAKADSTETANHFSQVETSISNINAEQKTQNDRLTAIETKDTEQDASIKVLQTENTTQDTNITKAQTTADGAVTKNTQQDQRMTDIEDHISDIDDTISSMNTTIIDNNEQFELFKDEQMLKNNAIDEKDGEQDEAISNAQSTADGAVSKNTKQDETIAALQTMLGETQKQVSANSTKNSEQDTAINNAQSTANNAMPKTGGTFTGTVEFPSLAFIKSRMDEPHNTTPKYVCTFNNNISTQGMSWSTISEISKSLKLKTRAITDEWGATKGTTFQTTTNLNSYLQEGEFVLTVASIGLNSHAYNNGSAWWMTSWEVNDQNILTVNLKRAYDEDAASITNVITLGKFE